MANIRGIQPLAWGVETLTGYVVAASTRDVSSEEFVIKDEEGDIITHISGFGVKTEFTIELIPKTATVEPAIASVVTVGSEKFVLVTLSKKRMEGDVEKWSMKGVSHPGITLTT
jgi:hypothetical protein